MAYSVIQFKKGFTSNLRNTQSLMNQACQRSYDLYVGIDSTINNQFVGSGRYW